MFLLNRMVDGLLSGVGWMTLMLQRFLLNMLAGMQAVAAVSSAAAESMQQFMAEFLFLLGQILLTLARVGVVLLPGGALLAFGFLRHF